MTSAEKDEQGSTTNDQRKKEPRRENVREESW